jgi:hypothetical protein
MVKMLPEMYGHAGKIYTNFHYYFDVRGLQGHPLILDS